MTLSQARKRYPLVPAEILEWAVHNVSDARELQRFLGRIEQTRRAQIRYSHV